MSKDSILDLPLEKDNKMMDKVISRTKRMREIMAKVIIQCYGKEEEDDV